MPIRSLHRHVIDTGTRVLQGGGAGLRIEEVRLEHRSDRRRFIDVQGALYAQDPHFVAPLRRDQHWLLNPGRSPVHYDLEVSALVATRRGRPVGRLTAHRNRAYDRVHGSGVGWFGFFESVDDIEVAEALIESGSSWLRRRKVRQILGPANFTTQREAGVLVDHQGPSAGAAAVYNPPYHLALLSRLGFQAAQDRLSWSWDLDAAMACPTLARLAAEAERSRDQGGIRVRPVDMRHLEQDLGPWHAIVNAAAYDTWGVPPMSRQEFDCLAFDVARVAREGLVLFAEVDGRPVGYALTVPDVGSLLPKDGRLLPFGWYRLLTQRCAVTRGRLLRLEVLPGFRDRGIETQLLVETARRAHAAGLRQVEVGGIWESQHSLGQAMRQLGASLCRRHRLLKVDLGVA